MTRWPLLLICCLVLGLAAAGCGDDEDEEGAAAPTATEQPATTTETQTETTGTEAAEEPETVTIDMRDIKYIPAEETVEVGTTVRWTNSDQVAHTVTKEAGPGAFDSGNIAAGEDYERTFDEPGTIDYVCTIHPGQKGTLTVER